jgi:hypothetical protein
MLGKSLCWRICDFHGSISSIPRVFENKQLASLDVFFPIILGSEKKLLLVIFPVIFTTKLLFFPSHGHLADLAGEVLDWASKGVLLGLSSLGSQLVASPGLGAWFGDLTIKH